MAQAINIVRTGAGLSFSPAQLAVETGAPVFWVNLDPQAAHQVVQAPGATPYEYTDLLSKKVEGAEPAVSGTILVTVDLSYALNDDSSVQGAITISTVQHS
jgi:plastocyanin